MTSRDYSQDHACCDHCNHKSHRTIYGAAATWFKTILTGTALYTTLAASPGVRLLTDGLMPDQLVMSFSLSSALAADADENKSDTRYTCPMHPHYIANEFGTCPICGMDLVPLQTGDNNATAPSSETRQSITVSAETIQNMGVRTAKAEMASFGRQIRAYGIVKENQRLQYAITNRLDGWIEELNVKAVGDPVTKGDELYRIYSPELYVSQRDYLLTLQAGAPSRQRAAELRLRSYGVQDRFIRQLGQNRKATMQVPFYAEGNGTVSRLDITTGSFVKRGSMLAMIQDYSKVWLVVSVAEQDIGFLSKNSIAKVSFPTLKDRSITAKIDYIYPTIDSASRTGQVRLVVENKTGDLRPGTYADVVFEVGAEQKLAVPTESLLNSENGRYVILSNGNGRFEPRNIKVGLTSGGLTEVVSGLSQNDEIVVSGQFLLDSESALSESFRKLKRLQTPLPLLDLDKNEMAMVDHIVDAALYLHEALIDGYDVDPKFLEPAKQIRQPLWPKFQHTQLAFVLTSAETAIGNAQKARTNTALHDALNELTEVLKPWIMEGKPDHYKGKNLKVFKEVKSGRLWLQLGEKPLNPYSRAKAELLPWPALEMAAKPDQDQPDNKDADQNRKMSAGGAHVH